MMIDVLTLLVHDQIIFIENWEDLHNLDWPKDI